MRRLISALFDSFTMTFLDFEFQIRADRLDADIVMLRWEWGHPLNCISFVCYAFGVECGAFLQVHSRWRFWMTVPSSLGCLGGACSERFS